jgi:glycosyltransferase involved in cell wall biosynthesis
VPLDDSRPIRIRFEHTRFPHFGNHSGYPQFTRFLDSRRYVASLHGASDDGSECGRWLYPFKPVLQRLIARGGMPWYKLSDFNAELEAFLACLRGRADIVHFLDGEHSGQYLPRMLRAARLSSVRVIASFHQPPGILNDLVDPRLLRQFDRIVLMSPSQIPYFAQHVAADRLRVILHGVDTDFFRPRAAPTAVARLRCITVGHWLRDWDVFKAVAASLPDVSFDVVTGQKTLLEERANVRLFRTVEDDRLAELYRQADILFLPLIDSTANNALLEGLASGLPIVSSDLVSVRAYVPEPAAILVARNSVEGFIAALKQLRSDAELRARMALAARARAMELAWPKLVGEYERLYEEVRRQSSCRG